MTETKLLLLLFFGVALVIGVYFTWVLLRNEMDGKPEEPDDPYDYGFGPSPGKTGLLHKAPPSHGSHPRGVSPTRHPD